MLKKILIANRGEIAVRVIRACREMGIESVAVYSEVDRNSLHVQEADEAVLIGEAPAAESYLNIERIMQAVRDTGAQAVHPGYGFLAENAMFSRRCEEAGIVFIGPDSKAMELVGDKIRSRQIMQKAGIPIIPGMKNAESSPATFARKAEAIGYPVMIKASAGGGGKGMRIVRDPDSLNSALEAGRREARSAFGDDSVYLEKYIEEPRHVEFQILADHYGNIVHVFERECSIQRRHQKIIEESPSPALDPELRSTMGATAIQVMRTAGYTNAGTVEFLLDKNKRFYFLEVNARLQVEHPVTELVSGLDLVHEQIRIASGEKLRFSQEMLQSRGHALECRIYAEDPDKQFLPYPGKILYLKSPQGPGIRHDAGIYSGWEVPIHYDPILAKLIVWAEDREAACRRMEAALGEYVVLGVKTCIGFLRDVMRHPQFRSGCLSTDFLVKYFDGWKSSGSEEGQEMTLAALAAVLESGTRLQKSGSGLSPSQEVHSPWIRLGKWEMGGGGSGL